MAEQKRRPKRKGKGRLKSRDLYLCGLFVFVIAAECSCL
jgi:hypothetical protein